MAFPTILVDSATGSDTQASGAGPTTALFGTTDASFSGAAVTLTAGTDLTNVLDTGAHVLYLLTSTGVRFFKITAKAGSGGATPTVDVTPNPAGTASGLTWAIGGKRASCFSASSYLLFNNGSAAGDALPGWIVEMQSGHSEARATAVECPRAGDATDGPIMLRGESGAATIPLITFGNNSYSFDCANFWVLADFEVRNNHGTKTASQFYANFNNGNGAGAVSVRGITCTHATDKYWRFWSGGTTAFVKNAATLEECNIANTADVGIVGVTSSSVTGLGVRGCRIQDTGNHGILIDKSAGELLSIEDNVISGCAGNGIYLSAAAMNTHGGTIKNNTVDDCAGSGIRITGTQFPIFLANNQLTNNGAYGFEFDGTLAAWNASGSLATNNNTHGNTSGAYSVSGIGLNDPAVDPDYVNAAAGNFTPQTAALEGAAFPTSIDATDSFGWPGAIQPEDVEGAGVPITWRLGPP